MVATTRAQKAQQTRAMMVHAAASEFARKGYDATSLADIAATFDRPKESLRYHFASKAALAEAVLEVQYLSWNRLEATVRDSPLEGLTGLLTLLGAAADESARSPFPRAAIALLTNEATLDIELPEVPFDWFAVTCGYLSDAAEHGEILEASLCTDAAGVPSLEATAAVLINASFGVHQAHHQDLGSVDILHLLAQVWRPLLIGFGAKNPDEVLARALAAVLSLRT